MSLESRSCYFVDVSRGRPTRQREIARSLRVPRVEQLRHRGWSTTPPQQVLLRAQHALALLDHHRAEASSFSSFSFFDPVSSSRQLFPSLPLAELPLLKHPWDPWPAPFPRRPSSFFSSSLRPRKGQPSYAFEPRPPGTLPRCQILLPPVRIRVCC